MPGRLKGEVPEESAPAMKEPRRARKVSVDKADGERAKANAEAKANGEPNTAMREGATGAESPAGKIDGGKAPRKPRAKKAPPAEGTT
jgi:NADH-quinone oxidoreductase subunit E